MADDVPPVRRPTPVTVHVLGVDVTLRETERLQHQGGGRSDLVSYKVHLGEAFIGDLEAFWVLREDSSRSTTKEFAGIYPDAKDWEPSGLRSSVLADLVRHHMEREQKTLDAELESLRREKERTLEILFELQKSIDEKTARFAEIDAVLQLGPGVTELPTPPYHEEN